ncbi:MAG: hypothetical protein SOY60_05680 [Fusobacterium gastrosuis]|uniref:hypothetical protein n=1 Tax=Fusobacterium TaxID=848 RepID=UPI001F4FFD8A|nr:MULTISPECIES: hypothetical protein [Fusobacterium]MDD7392527.1 hypothetical protein [Fusobacteriaceae bacterium]MCI7223402.1 hypothetical protein [Fusobacterium sp.]MDD7410609.1 hypothetical protein [Fusobacteriaceae bacterium]MDY4011136.1 hypothetical protein [Fusobacterium gastrosuis]MDY5305334.1 hypothetical protein [Fusobacterium gastrosuis]
MKEELDIVTAVFNNKKMIDNIFENLKKELMEVIFMENFSVFKKAIFIQGVFNYANLILNANQTMSEEEKTFKMTELIDISRMLNETYDESIVKYRN